MLSGVSIAKEIGGVGDKGSGQTIIVDIDTFWSHYEHVPEICLFC